jgi:DNA-binding MarR family transcriptional regulator
VSVARPAGRDKQTIGAILDELQKIGYVTRVPDPADGRARLIVPTGRGREWKRVSDEIVADIERRHAARVGESDYAAFKRVFTMLTETVGGDC